MLKRVQAMCDMCFQFDSGMIVKLVQLACDLFSV